MLWKRSVKRHCPECDHGMLDTSEIFRGAECPYCHCLLEVNFRYSAGIPIVLAFLIILSFTHDYGIIGLTLTGLMVVYDAGYRSVFARYLPLKRYEK